MLVLYSVKAPWFVVEAPCVSRLICQFISLITSDLWWISCFPICWQMYLFWTGITHSPFEYSIIKPSCGLTWRCSLCRNQRFCAYMLKHLINPSLSDFNYALSYLKMSFFLYNSCVTYIVLIYIYVLLGVLGCLEVCVLTSFCLKVMVSEIRAAVLWITWLGIWISSPETCGSQMVQKYEEVCAGAFYLFCTCWYVTYSVRQTGFIEDGFRNTAGYLCDLLVEGNTDKASCKVRQASGTVTGCVANKPRAPGPVAFLFSTLENSLSVKVQLLLPGVMSNSAPADFPNFHSPPLFALWLHHCLLACRPIKVHVCLRLP